MCSLCTLQLCCNGAHWMPCKGADPFFEVNGAVAVDQTPNDATEEFLLLQEKIRDRKLQREKKEREKAKAASKDSPRQEF